MEHTVTPLHCGTLLLDKGDVLTRGVDTGVVVATPSISFLVEGPSEIEPVLVDTSFGDVELMAERWPAYPCRRPPGRSITDQLGANGYSPDDIETVVLSHLDWDHCYNLDLFTHADVYVQRTEVEERYADGFPMEWDAPWSAVELTFLDGETELAPGIVAFHTPGHQVGHQSLEVSTADGTTVIAADAIPTFENLEPSDDGAFIPGGINVSDEDWWRSAREIVDRADVILPGHEWGILDVEPPDDATP